MFPADKVTVRGVVAEYRIENSHSIVTRSFCSTCGSPLFGRNTRMPGAVTICVGSLDDPNSVTPQVVVFARSRRRWDLTDTELPTFDTQPDWRPEDGV
jgi:hypothetical protein